MRVQVITHDEPNPLLTSRRLVSLLDQLGFRTTLRVFPTFPQFAGYVGDSRNRAQIGVLGWSINVFEYCNRKLDAQVSHAIALEASDPGRANELWATIDRAIVDQAVAVPVTNGLDPVLLSERVGNYQDHPLWGTLFDQLWVK